MITGVHHVGQIVEDFDAALALYVDVLGATVFETREAEHENDVEGEGQDEADTGPAVRMAFTEVPDCELHLIAREQRGSDLDPLLDSLLDVSRYHVAYAVPNIAEAISGVEQAGYTMHDSEPVSGLGPYRRAFADPESVPGIPFEFVELTG